MPITTLIFDFGSVLLRMVDETPRHQLAAHYDIPLETIYQQVFDSPTAAPASLGKLTIAQHWEAVFAALNIPPAERSAFTEQFWSADALDEALIAYIRTLRRRYKIGLLSNAWDDLRQALDERFGIVHDFDKLIISAEVGLAKPDPRIYHLALERLGAQPAETVFLDDVSVNVDAARAVGLHAIQYRDFAQAREELERLIDLTGFQNL